MEDNSFLEIEYKEQTNCKPVDVDDSRVFAFKNVFAFMDFCYKYKFTTDNSITYYNEVTQVMFIKKIK